MNRLTNKQLRCRHNVAIDMDELKEDSVEGERTIGVMKCVKCNRKINFYTTLEFRIPSDFTTLDETVKSKDVWAHDTIFVEPIEEAK